MPSSHPGLSALLTVLKSPPLSAEFADDTDLWTEVKRLADIHRFAGLLAHQTSQWLPARERAWRDQVLMTHHRRHSQRLAALRRVADAFRSEGIASLSLKGPLLAERYYSLPFLRPANDLDILIEQRDIGPSTRLLAKLGYRLNGTYPWKLHFRVQHDLEFAPTEDLCRVEIHYNLRSANRTLESSKFLERSVPWKSPTGEPIQVLSRADEAFYVCIHAANHAFHRLRWLYDAITIARTLTPEDRSRVREMAIEYRQTGNFVAARLAAREFFDESLELDCAGFPVPRLWSRLEQRHTRNMVERVDGTTATFAEKIGCRLDLFRMAGSPWDAARLFAWQADIELRKLWYDLRHTADPGTLARTLPD